MSVHTTTTKVALVEIHVVPCFFALEENRVVLYFSSVGCATGVSR